MGLTWLSPGAFATRAADGGLPEPYGLRKAFTTELAPATDDSRVLTFALSTPAVDREQDSIAVEGWDVAAYMANPVMLWAHDYSQPPIARATRVWTEEGALRASAEFTPPEINAFGDSVYRMYRAGFLNAVSVGFQPVEWTFDEQRKGVNFLKQNLLEFSAVPVPANPEALVQARGLGIDLTPLGQWAAQVLDAWPADHAHPELRAAVERVWKAGTSPLVPGAGLPPDPVAKAEPEDVDEDECPMGDACGYDEATDSCDAADCPMAKGCRPKPSKALIVELIDEDEPLALALRDEGWDFSDLTLGDPEPALALPYGPAEVRAALAAVIRDEVHGAINRLRGRVD